MALTKVKLIADGVITSANLDASHGITTSDIGEGSNLYYTDARVSSYLSTNGFATQTDIVAAITDSAPVTLDTLNELAAALGDDPNFATTTATSLGLKAPLASPSFTGNASFAGSVTLSQNGTNFEHGYAGNGLVLSHYNVGPSNAIVSGGASNPDTLFINNGGSASDWSNVVITGNVGIGTDSPTTKTEIKETNNDIYQLTLYNNHISTTSKARIGNWNDEIKISSNYMQSGGTKTQDNTAKSSWVMSMGAAGDAFDISRSPAASTTLSSLMTIDSSGRVGIGTTSPLGKLQLNVDSDHSIMRITAGDSSIAGIDFGKTSDIDDARIRYYNSTRYMEFFVANGERMRIDSSGNVLINATSKYNTYPASFVTQTLASDSGDICPILELVGNRSANAGNQNAMIQFFNKTSTAVEVGRITSSQGSATNSGELKFDTSNAGTLSERMRIDSSGQVIFKGTGNSIDLRFKDISAAISSETAGYIGLSTSAYSGNNGDLVLIPRTSAASNILLMQGNVGIGTTSPAALLDVAGNIYGVRLYVNSGGNATDPMIRVKTDTNTGIFFPADDTLAITTGGSERMRIASSGRVFVNNNTYSRDAYMHIEGDSSNYALYLYAPVQYSSNYRYQRFWSGNNIAGGIEGVNQTSVSYTTSSDYRMKKNIKPLENGLDRVCKLKPVKFDWKLNDESTEGFIAHEVQEIFPEAVSGEKDGEDMQGMDYGRITPLLVKAIQELKADNDNLRERIQTLENQ